MQFRILSTSERAAAILALLLTLSSASAFAAPKVLYDWNDGTLQGWGSSSPASNNANRLQANNSGNGSLQIFGPLSSYSLNETDVISFELEIVSYSTVASPADLNGTFSFTGPFPGTESLNFNLDLSGLAFGETRKFTLPVSAGTYTGNISRAAFLADPGTPNFYFADSNNDANQSVALLDNFRVDRKQAVPIPGLGMAGKAILALLILVLVPISLRRARPTYPRY